MSLTQPSPHTAPMQYSDDPAPKPPNQHHAACGWVWVCAMLSWLGGVACHLQRSELGVWWHDLAYASGASVLAFMVGRHIACRPLWRTASIALAIFAWGHGVSGLHAHYLLSQELPAHHEGQNLRLTGVIAGLPQPSANGIRFAFEVDDESWQTLKASGTDQSNKTLPKTLLLGWYTPWGEDGSNSPTLPSLLAGERWALSVRLKKPHGLFNPHGFDREFYLFEQGVRATGSVRKGERLETTAAYPVQRWRQLVRDDIEAKVSNSRSAGVLAALAVGDQGAIEPGDWNQFRDTGVAHLMSISGLHVTMFAWLAGLLIQMLWRQSTRAMHWRPAPWAARWGGLLAALAYAVFSGWGVPAQRTVWMLAVVTLVQAGGRRWPWPWVLLAAAVVVTALHPWALLQAGFWLSFAAVALLMISSNSEPEQPTAPEARWVRRALSWAWAAVKSGVHTQWIATLGLAPLSLVIFQQISLVGLAANLIAIPVVTLLITPLALLGIVWPITWSMGDVLVRLLGQYLAWLASWPSAVWSVPVAPWWAQLAGLLAGALWMARLPWALRTLSVPLLLPLLWPAPISPPSGEFDVLALDIGQGTSVMVRTAHHLMVFDTGPTYDRDSDAGQRVLVPLLKAMGESQIDRLILSHRDLDHVGGASSLLGEISVKSLWSSLETYHLVQLQAAAMGVEIQRCQAGQSWQWDGVQFEVLHPQPSDYARPLRPNAMSCVVRVSAGRSSLLLTGDIEKAEEATLTGAMGQALASTVLIAPHHGSRTSSTPGFLDAVQPAMAIVQAGYRNRFGHPAPTVTQRYTEHHIPLRISTTCGAWRWRSSQSPAQGNCERDSRRRYWHEPAPPPIDDDAPSLD